MDGAVTQGVVEHEVDGDARMLDSGGTATEVEAVCPTDDFQRGVVNATRSQAAQGREGGAPKLQRVDGKRSTPTKRGFAARKSDFERKELSRLAKTKPTREVSTPAMPSNHEPKKRGRGKEGASDLLSTKTAKKATQDKPHRVCQDEVDFVTGVDGKTYAVGATLGKSKVFGKGGEQLSKSCHQCQDQHIAWTCLAGRTQNCNASYCSRCISNWYTGWTLKELRKCCPRCQSFCNCRACLRRDQKHLNPEFSEAQLLEYAHHVLRVAGPHVKNFLDVQKEEASIDGVDAADLNCKDDASFRVSCDECATSIPNIYRACNGCGIDMCIACCQESRKTQGKSSCPKCSKPMELKGLLSSAVFALLGEVAKAFGSCSGDSYWKWLSATSRTTPKSRKRKSHQNDDINQMGTPTLGRVINPNRPNFTGKVPSKWVLASQRPDGKQNYIYCPDACDFDLASPNRAAAVQQFQECMRAGEPVIIRGLGAKMNWGPETMLRACMDRGNKWFNSHPRPHDVLVTDCADGWEESIMPQRRFFNLYQKADPGCVLKVKDWPSEESFTVRLKRHNQDFLEALPLPEYMHPSFGPLNSYRSLPTRWLPPNLGPKADIAIGRIPEHEGETNCVTKLHIEMSDTVSVMCHAQYNGSEHKNIRIRKGNEVWDKPSYGYAGAVWDIVRREDMEKVNSYLWGKKADFQHRGLPVSEHRLLDPIFDEMFTLTEKNREELRKDHDVHVWHFEQHIGDAVYIPVGCPHQIRNLRPCLKAAIGFVPLESYDVLERLKDTNRRIGIYEKDTNCNPMKRKGSDKLQGTAMLLHAAKEAYCTVQKHGCPNGNGHTPTMLSKFRPADKKWLGQDGW